MCGIAGFIDFAGNSNVEILQNMTLSLLHRGPDDHGLELLEGNQAQIGFGHTRLSIMDLSPLGHQPMSVDDWIITFNGEIYNFNEIRPLLEADGITFKSHSDTEVILRCFQKWGVSCVERFHGMFSFVIYNKTEGKLWMVRDRVGVKPLYYYQHDNLILFSSELKAFHKHPSFKKEIDVASLGLFLQYNYIPGPHCIFQRTKKLMPGHYLEISLRDRSVVLKEYWNGLENYKKPTLNISEAEAINETERVLTKAFNYRMVADVPVGLFLSGGFDSSAVAALLQKDRTEKLKTFTIGFDVTGFDEAPDARKIANHLGTDHTEYYCSPEDALSIIPALPEIYDEPFADNSTVPTVLVSRLARKSVTVALSGDGGDEIFGGYNKFNRSLALAKGSSGVKHAVAGLMGTINPDHIPVLRNQFNFTTRYEKIRQILGSNDPAEILKVISQFIPSSEVKTLISKSYEDLKTDFDLKGGFRENDPLAHLLAIDLKTFLIDNNLVKMDRATMSVALEGREPFLDQSVIEYAAQLPSSYKIKDGVNKHLLKEIVYKHIPKSLMDRPKKPFLAPLSVWFMDKLKDFFINYLDESRLKQEGYLNYAPIVKMRNEFLSGRKINHQKLWNIFVFEMWYERWMK